MFKRVILVVFYICFAFFVLSEIIRVIDALQLTAEKKVEIFFLPISNAKLFAQKVCK